MTLGADTLQSPGRHSATSRRGCVALARLQSKTMRRALWGALLCGGLGLGLSGVVSAQTPDNSCQWARDAVCDEARFGGGGACPTGTDTADCIAQAAALMARLTRAVRQQLGNDTCQYAHDLECDDARFGGTGACAAGTDATDCRAAAAGGDDSCGYALDGECDEPGIGTGLCPTASDQTDCAPVAFLAGRSNTCETAFNGICDEPGPGGTGTCAARSDTADCVGRERPAAARDHFFGFDDRKLVDPTLMPWRAVGLLVGTDMDCTGTLIAARLVLTAAHCVSDGRKTILPDLFRAGAHGLSDLGEARILSAFVSPDFSDDYAALGAGNGADWAIVTLDRDLGSVAGIVPPRILTDADLAQIRAGDFRVDQAGYSWDTGDWLSGHMRCMVLTAFDDGTIAHACDTAEGDSGSPLFHLGPSGWAVIAVDSRFASPLDDSGAFGSSHLAVDTRAMVRAFRDFGVLK